MTRLSVLALVVVILAAAGVGFAARPADSSSPYGLVQAVPGTAPAFKVQDGMTSVRRVGVGRYCLLAAVKFDHQTIGQVSADTGLSQGRVGVVTIDSSGKRCKPEELGVITFQVRAGGRLGLSNAISFAANPEG